MNIPRLSTLPSEMFDYLFSLKFHHSAESSKRVATSSLHLFLSGFGIKRKRKRKRKRKTLAQRSESPW